MHPSTLARGLCATEYIPIDDRVARSPTDGRTARAVDDR
jgi:hypothetical protein